MPTTKPSKPYTFTSGTTADPNHVNQDFDLLYSKIGEVIDMLNASAGSLPSLSERLAAAINDDGTLKGDVAAGTEWLSFETVNLAKVSTSSFKLDYDKTSIYTAGRRVKLKLDDDSIVYGKVSSATFTPGGNGYTTVTLTAAVLTLPLVAVWHSILQPIASSGAVDADMLGAYTKTETDALYTTAATANKGVKRDASGRAKVAAPAAADDVARKDTVDAHANLSNPHNATASATGDRIAMRDSSGDLIARLFRTEYASPGGLSGAGYFLGQNAVGAGADNYARPVLLSELLGLLGCVFSDSIIKIGGYIIQWGSATSGDQNYSGTLAFPVAFPAACLCIVGTTPTNQPAAVNGNNVGAQALNNSQYRVFSDDAPKTVNWIAIGR